MLQVPQEASCPWRIPYHLQAVISSDGLLMLLVVLPPLQPCQKTRAAHKAAGDQPQPSLPHLQPTFLPCRAFLAAATSAPVFA
jgi:hypothetical protein